jgi:hypothetical protein
MIEQWLARFTEAWKSHDIDGVMSLFSEDVRYFETPFQELKSLDEIQAEWSAIENQSAIQLHTTVYSNENNRSTITWTLSYENESHQPKHWAGIYLVELNNNGRCTYFYQVGEQLPSGNS